MSNCDDAGTLRHDKPYGTCKCPEHGEKGCNGPAALCVTRVKKEYSVCSRCFLPDDENRTLLVGGDDCIKPFLEWDPLGALYLSMLTAEVPN